MDFSTDKLNDVIIVSIPGDVLDATNTSEFKRDINTILEENSKVIFNMSGMRFIDSSGCGALLSCVRKLKAKNGELKLFNVSKQVLNLFKMIRLDQILGIFSTKDETIESFR